MKATELRIGNIVKCTISRSTHGRFDHIGLNINHLHDIVNNNPDYIYEPIFLTEEWLLKFEFANRKSHSFDKNKLAIHFEENRIYWNSWFILDVPKYVHQLQNLYFALTGEELTIKETA